jgi:hypothetical protein
MARRRRYRRGDYLSELQRELTPVRRPSLIVLLWRWRWELMLGTVLPAEVTAVVIWFGWMWFLALLAIVIVTLTVWPTLRHLLVAQIRCIITEHRIRTGCAQAWIQSRYGRLPIILLTIPHGYGERVYIWCPAGISLEDFEEARDILRSACWASQINVAASGRYSQIVVLDVIH